MGRPPSDKRWTWPGWAKPSTAGRALVLAAREPRGARRARPARPRHLGDRQRQRRAGRDPDRLRAGKIVPIPASIPHEAGDMVDRRIVPDLLWIAQRYPIYVTDGYSGPLPNGTHVGCNRCHTRGSDHYNGLAVDLVPAAAAAPLRQSWAPITRLAHWAEPTQNHPVAALPLGRLRRRRRARLRQPPAPLLEPRPRTRAAALASMLPCAVSPPNILEERYLVMDCLQQHDVRRAGASTGNKNLPADHPLSIRLFARPCRRPPTPFV